MGCDEKVEEIEENELNINSTIKLNNGVEMPLFGLGTYQNKGDECVDVIKWALKAGYKHIDTAQLYGNETEIGKAIKESDVDRKDLFITSKIWGHDYENSEKL